jgi:hypothetical protein
MTFDLYAWSAPRDLDSEAARTLIAEWQDAGGDPAHSPFEPSSDLGWFHRELLQDHPGLEVSSDAVRSTSTRPVWLETEQEPPARAVAIRLPAVPDRDLLASIFGLATKYDLVIFEPRSGTIHHPLAEMAEYASATFWPRGAIQAAVAGAGGAIIALIAWFVGLPLISGVAVVAGGFLFVMAVFTFAHEGQKRLRGRRKAGGPD